MLRTWFLPVIVLVVGIALVALGGCSGATPTPFPKTTPVPIPTIITVIAPYEPPPTYIAPTSAISSTQTFAPTALPPAIGLTLITATPGTTTRATPTLAATVPAGKMRVQIYMIAMNDKGKSGKKIGCDDSVVAVDRFIPLTNAPLTATLNDLFAIREQVYGQSGLYNALSQSSLKIEGINIVAAKATISLSGKLTLGGECDNPRVEAQIKETALQFSTVKDVAILINNVSLDRVLSGKGN